MLISGSRFQPPRAAETLLEEALTPHQTKQKGGQNAINGGEQDAQEGGQAVIQQPVQYKELPSYRAFTYQDLTKADKYWRSSGQIGGVKDIVVIHVCDENRKVTRDFNCRRDILMNNMKYFKGYLSNSENALDEVPK